MAFDVRRNRSLSRCAYRAVRLPSRAISEACKLQGGPNRGRDGGDCVSRAAFRFRLQHSLHHFLNKKRGCRQCTLRLRPSERVIVGDLINRMAQKRGTVGETPNLATRLQGIRLAAAAVVEGEKRRETSSVKWLRLSEQDFRLYRCPGALRVEHSQPFSQLFIDHVIAFVQRLRSPAVKCPICVYRLKVAEANER